MLGASLGLLAILFHSVVDFNLHIPANAILAVTLMASLSCCTRFATDNYWFTARAPAKIFATIILAAGLGYLGWQEIRRAREYHWLDRAQRAQDLPTERAAALEKALAIEPRNPATAYELGEAFRLQSWDGHEDYAELADQAMKWFERGTQLNPYDGYNFLCTGMCLDWTGQHETAGSFFDRAAALDPNGYFTSAWIGWHYVQLKDYAAAKVWLQRSHQLDWNSNVIAEAYLQICSQKMLEAATNSKPATLAAPAH